VKHENRVRRSCALELVRKAIAHGPSRVMVDSSGYAVSPKLYFEMEENAVRDGRQLCTRPIAHMWVREDGWSLAAPTGLSGVLGKWCARNYEWVAALWYDGDWKLLWIVGDAGDEESA